MKEKELKKAFSRSMALSPHKCLFTDGKSPSYLILQARDEEHLRERLNLEFEGREPASIERL